MITDNSLMVYQPPRSMEVALPSGCSAFSNIALDS